MKFRYFLAILILFSSSCSSNVQKTERYIAVTIDDLPVASKPTDLRTQQEITRRLLAHIAKAAIPAVGFVNEGKLHADEKRVEEEIDLLRSWVKARLELGNHTYSHMSLHGHSLEEYQEDILKGEIVTKKIIGAEGKRMRYFRHPYLHTGLDLDTKRKLGQFLTQHDYTIAPVTIDNSDWIFARAYDDAIERKDKKLMERIGAAYVTYLEAKTDYWERQSVEIFGREIKQILLLHANSLNADFLDDIARMLKGGGYRFVSLENALTDEAYKLPDTFTQNAGISWLHRWALAKGRGHIIPDEPRTPGWVMKEAGVDSE